MAAPSDYSANNTSPYVKSNAVRVVIDALPLLIPSAGVKTYLYYWIDALRRAAGNETIRTCPNLRRLGPLNHEGSVAGRWTTYSSLASLARSNYTSLPVFDWNARRADIFHCSNLRLAPPRRTRVTTTIHDVTCWLMPELHTTANVRADRRFVQVIKGVDAAIAISQNTKNDAIRVLGLDSKKITVIPPGVPPAFFEVTPAAVNRVRKRYRLNRPFVLFVGTIEPRKNIDTLLDAYESLPTSVREEFEMVIGGSIGWAHPATTARLSRVHYLGYVPEPDIAPLTAAAVVLAYPSFYEGFGFPVVQAMAAGVPVVTSNVSSLPEVAGDAALLVDPHSTAELRDALLRLLLCSDLRADLARRGRYRAQLFRWENCASQSLRWFESLVL